MPRFAVIARDSLILDEAVAVRIPPGTAVERHYVADLTLEDIFGQLCTADLFASARALHYINFLSWKLSKKEGERLAGILDRIAPEVTLVCSQVLDYSSRAEEQRALKSQTYRCWTAGVTVDDLRAASEGARAIDWLSRRARERYALVMTRNQVQRLLSVSDDRPALAEGELRKLWMLKSDDQPQPVSDATLDATLSASPGAHFYRLVDAIMSRVPDALPRLSQWYKLEPKAERLVGELKRRLLGMLALHRGESIQPQFLSRQLQAVRRKWPPDELVPTIQRLAQLEHDLKSGATTGRSSQEGKLSALQLFVAELAST